MKVIVKQTYRFIITGVTASLCSYSIFAFCYLILIIDGPKVDENLARAARNIDSIDVLPSVGINVYDILKKNTLVLTRSAVVALEERFK